MIECRRCGTKNLEGSLYCDECGDSLSNMINSKDSQNNEVAVSQPSFDPKATSYQIEPIPIPVYDFEKHSEKPLESPVFDVIPSAAEEGRSNATDAVPAVSDEKPSTSIGVHAKLLIERGHSAGKQFALSTDETNIGRWDADSGIFPDVDLDTDDPEAKVSRRHARIIRKSSQYLVEDLGSTNGTFINRGRRLLPGDKQVLSDGDEIIVGKTFMRFHIVK
jgi:FHA domain